MLSKLFGISFGLGVLALVATKGHGGHVHQVMDLPRDPAKLLDEAIDILPSSLTTSQWHAAIDVLELEIARHDDFNSLGTIHVPYLVECVVNYVRRNRDGEKNILDWTKT